MTAILQRNRRGDRIPKTGDKFVDDANDDMTDVDDDNDNDPTLPDDVKEGMMPALKMLLEESKKGRWYSLTRALGQWVDHGRVTGLEGEVSQELVRYAPNHTRGFRVPWRHPVPNREQRALTSTSGPGAITAQMQAPVDVLRSKMVCKKLGANIVNLTGAGPSGYVSIPVRTAGSTVSWVAENTAPSSSTNATTGQAQLRPNTVMAFSDITRRMLTLGQEGFGNYSMDELFRAVSVAVDTAAVSGAGGSSQPTGLLTNVGLPTVTPAAGLGGAIAYADLVQVENVVGMNNGDAPGDCKLGWVTSPQGRKALRKCDLGGATVTGRYAWKAHTHVVDNERVIVEEMLGWPALSTCAVPANLNASNYTQLGFGNWNDVIINLWGGFDLDVVPDALVDPFLQSTTGVVRIAVFMDCDVALLRGGSFCTCSGFAAAY